MRRDAGSEAADAYAKDAAERISATFPKRRATEGQCADARKVRQNEIGGRQSFGSRGPDQAKGRAFPPGSAEGQRRAFLPVTSMTLAPFLRGNGGGSNQTSAGGVMGEP